MKAVLALATVTVAGSVLLVVPAEAPSAPAAKPLLVHQEPRGTGHLVARGDRVEIAYGINSPGVQAAGSLYVRTDLERRFRRLHLKRVKPPAAGLYVRPPARLIHGHKLLYYAVVHDRRSGRSATVPAAGARAPQTAWILERPVMVRLGVHRFGQVRAPEAVVARARPDEVGWQLPPPGCGCGPPFGPQTFLVGRDGSVWLHDGLSQRLLVWRPGAPDVVARSLSLPFLAADDDVALGPNGTVYVTRVVGIGRDAHLVLYRLDADGNVLWQSNLAYPGSPEFALGVNTSLRVGPDGTLYCLVAMWGWLGDEPAWMPVATPAGRPLSVAQQLARTQWPFQPVAGRMRLVSELHVAHVDSGPREARFALIDRRGRVARSWRVLSKTDINFNYTTPELVGGDPVVVLDATSPSAAGFKWEYLVLRLGPHGTRTRFSIARAVFGDNILADVRIGPDGNLYQLGSSPETGVVVSRYSLRPGR
jgi:hypothetical protein